MKRFYIILSVYTALVFQGIIGGYMGAMPLSGLGGGDNAVQASQTDLSSQNVALSSQNVIPPWICRTNANSDGTPSHPSDDDCEICLVVASVVLNIDAVNQFVAPDREMGSSHLANHGFTFASLAARGRHLTRAPPLTIV